MNYLVAPSILTLTGSALCGPTWTGLLFMAATLLLCAAGLNSRR